METKNLEEILDAYIYSTDLDKFIQVNYNTLSKLIIRLESISDKTSQESLNVINAIRKLEKLLEIK
jgi:hypothetical protein